MDLLKIIIGCIVVGGLFVLFMVKISNDFDEMFKTYSDEEVTEDWEQANPVAQKQSDADVYYWWNP
jgi:hypothetical protein